MEKWARKSEFDFFTKSGCGFSMTASLDITKAYNFAKERGYKLYPTLVALSLKVINAHKEFRYGYQNDQFGWFEESPALFFDKNKSGNVRCLCVDYFKDVERQVAEIDKLREQYKDSDEYRPQGVLPLNAVNISVIPWVSFTAADFSLQYAAYYYPPMIVFGKYEKKDGRVTIPLCVYANHAVNDGGHVALVFTALQELIDSL